MPTLKDTEWRLLCVVVRQTLGWQGEARGQRKERDWLAQKQLIARTGRRSEALSKATDALVRKGLIEVQDRAGKSLVTPQQRRRANSALYYRLRPFPAAKQEGKSELHTSESELRLSNTTKENGTKFIPKGRKEKECSSVESRKDPGQAAFGGEPTPEVMGFLKLYAALFKQHTEAGDLPVISWGRDGKLIKDLLKVYSYERLEDLLRQFFASPDAWLRKRGYALGAFRGAINVLLAAEAKATSERPLLRTGQWSRASQTHRPDQQPDSSND